MTRSQFTARQIRVADAIGAGRVRPFVTPNCPRCGTPLQDANGEPRWEIIGRLTFVCLGGCPDQVARRRAGLQ